MMSGKRKSSGRSVAMDDTNGDSIGIYDAENGVDTKVRGNGFSTNIRPYLYFALLRNVFSISTFLANTYSGSVITYGIMLPFWKYRFH